jgi:hypothetical protein
MINKLKKILGLKGGINDLNNMIIKEDIKDLRKVWVSIGGDKGAKFRDGKKTISFKVYDTTPDEVLEVIKTALRERSRYKDRK